VEKYELLSYGFQFFDTDPMYDDNDQRLYPGADGIVWYKVFHGCGVLYLHQLFKKELIISSEGDKPTSCSYDWSWDGDRENPTLTPSFLWSEGRLHLFVTHGNLDILPDTTVKCDKVFRSF